MNRYPLELKESLARRYLSSEVSYRELAAESGADASSIRSWVNALKECGSVSKKRKSSQIPVDARSAAEKLRLVSEASGLSDEERGEFLRREGVHDEDLKRWAQDALSGLEGGTSLAAKDQQIRRLERTRAKQDKRLKEAEALLDLQKKVHDLWGGAGSDTTDNSD